MFLFKGSLPEETDYTTKLVLEWLDHFNKDFIRINQNDQIEIVAMNYGNQSDTVFKVLGHTIKASKITSVWFRRGFMGVNNFLHFSTGLRDINSIEDGFKYALSAHSNARQEILEFIIHKSNFNTIGRNGLGRINKPNVLRIAEHIGFTIPNTILTTRKEDALTFSEIHPQGIITKSIDVNYYAHEYNENHVSIFNQYTTEITKKDIEQFPDTFALTTFQEKLVKLYEVRTFYWKGVCYSQAFFTQRNEKTVIDGRNYDHEKKTRSISLSLPFEIENKIKMLMDSLGLETGSLDFVRTPDDGFVFLEVNPRGQFGYLSKSCNYHLEQMIAQSL